MTANDPYRTSKKVRCVKKLQEMKWSRVLGEGAIIVVSILMAFSIDAWWEEQKERALEQRLLTSLISEFEGAAAEFDDQCTKHEQRREAAARIAELSAITISQLTPEDLWILWDQAASVSRSDPPQGTLASAIATGTISLIRNEELKFHLSGWGGRLADLQNTERDIAAYMIHVFLPDVSHRALLPYVSDVLTSDFADALLEIPIKNHMNWISMISAIAEDENEQMQDEIDKILELLHNEVAR